MVGEKEPSHVELGSFPLGSGKVPITLILES